MTSTPTKKQYNVRVTAQVVKDFFIRAGSAEEAQLLGESEFALDEDDTYTYTSTIQEYTEGLRWGTSAHSVHVLSDGRFFSIRTLVADLGVDQGEQEYLICLADSEVELTRDKRGDWERFDEGEVYFCLSPATFSDRRLFWEAADEELTTFLIKETT